MSIDRFGNRDNLDKRANRDNLDNRGTASPCLSPAAYHDFPSRY